MPVILILAIYREEVLASPDFDNSPVKPLNEKNLLWRCLLTVVYLLALCFLLTLLHDHYSLHLLGDVTLITFSSDSSCRHSFIGITFMKSVLSTRVFDKIFSLDQIGSGQAMGEPLYF